MENQQPSEDEHWIAFTIRNFERFGEVLHDRLDAVLYHFEEMGTKFMLITNLYDRDTDRIETLEKAKAKDLEQLSYCGTERQRHLLELHPPKQLIKRIGATAWDETAWRKERDKNWAALKYKPMTRDMEEVETFYAFDKFRRWRELGMPKGLGLEDIKVDTLSKYFLVLDNTFQENEYHIISDYFDISKDKYIGIPLMGMGLFQGIVWIVFDESETARFEDQATIKRLIKLFEYEYDHLLLVWDVTRKDINRRSITADAIKEVKEDNPIQTECRTKDYYDISQYYFEQRIEINDDVVARLRRQYQKTSQISILLDSYSHNISAHSLTTLGWWFRDRAEYIKYVEDKKLSGNAVLEDEYDTLEMLGRFDNPLIKHYNQLPRGSLSNELHRLFKFLLEKGAFWSAITRQTNFAGKLSSLFSILWYDFINNSLYLGTIANTEEINKVIINLTFFESENKPVDEPFINTKKIKKTPDGKLLDGTFAVVNFKEFDPDKAKLAEQSAFVQKGEMFNDFKQELENIRPFFPGALVGKHAFFTLIENEIRNVKHFEGDVLKSIQQNGLVLNITVHDRPVDSRQETPDTQYDLFKIGVFLKHPVQITAERFLRRIEDLSEDIVNDETFQPRLGGSSQDKICASMLMTNTFDKVEDKDTPLAEIYFPWIKMASSLICNDAEVVTDFEVSQRRFKEITGYTDNSNQGNMTPFDERFASETGPGYLKKYFHLWKGDDILNIQQEQDLPEADTLMNPVRFKFVALHNKQTSKKTFYKRNGIVRVIDAKKPVTDIVMAYQLWLKKMTHGEPAMVSFWEGNTPIAVIRYDDGRLRFYNYHQLRSFSTEEMEILNSYPHQMTLSIAHGSHLSAEKHRFNYRSHGEFISNFCEGKSLAKTESIEETKLYELFEAFITRICLFDRRIYKRFSNTEDGATSLDDETRQKYELQQARLELYRQQLNLDIRTEDKEDWLAIQERGFLKYNFVIVHLSFIESMGYKEVDIIRFIDEQILQGTPADQVDDSFILVITTGRGRRAWWDKMSEAGNQQYSRFTTFRPIESIIGAVEDALKLPDDINLKYNLVKLLFGS